jgi:hypothetical protein
MKPPFDTSVLAVLFALGRGGRRRLSTNPEPERKFAQPFAAGEIVIADTGLSGSTSRGVIRNVGEGEQGTVVGYDALGRVQVKFTVSGCDVLVNTRPSLFRKQN